MSIRLLFILLSFSALSALSALGQQNLSGSIHHSEFTYIYRISQREAITLFQSDMEKWGESYLHTLVDSFQTGVGSIREEQNKYHSPTEDVQLPPGNYLFVSAVGSHLSSTLRTIGDLQLDLLPNGHGLTFALRSRQGIPIPDAEAMINHSRISFDTATRTYRLDKRRKGGLVKVSYRGALYFFPLTYLITPVRHLFTRNEHHASFKYGTPYESRFYSFMVFNKPKYKPGDTVQGKAFILNRRKQPINRPLLLRISDRNLSIDSVIGLVRPYRAGGYTFSFVLTDSLHLDLDEDYLLTLEETGSSRYNLPAYEGDLDKDEYAAKRKVTARGNFTFEEYVLQSMRFNARTDKEENSPGNPQAIYLKATDENELPLADGRIQLYVRSTGQIDRSVISEAFLKDTLWSWSQALDPVGETKITIPDSIFPSVSFQYRIECILLNGNNERRNQTFLRRYAADTGKIFFQPHLDSLFIDYRVLNTSRSVMAILTSCTTNGDSIEKRAVTLPLRFRINPYAGSYRLITLPDSLHGEFDLTVKGQEVTCVANRTRDSVSIESVNPNHLYFWYTIFAGNKKISRGYNNWLSYHAPSITRKNYFISLQYAWSGKIKQQDYTVPFRDKLLQIDIREPSFVYPGQTTNIGIAVKNADGKPVANADLTAYSYTAKFENTRSSRMPYLGRTFPGRKYFPDFQGEEKKERNYTSLLNWKKWSLEMGLDTLEYYKFLHPASVYINREPARDRLTQIAPFVSFRGELLPVHQVYIDEIPVFFSQAQQLSRYSFYVQPGKHALRLRTNDRMIFLDSLMAIEGMKTFICINADTSNKAIYLKKLPDSLTNAEKNLWKRYMILVENNFGENFASISQNNRIVLLNPHQWTGGHFSFPILAGPFTGQSATLHVKNEFEQSFEPEGNYRFLLAPGLVKQRDPFTPYLFSSKLNGQTPDYNFHDWVLTSKEVDSLWQDYLDDRCAYTDLFQNEKMEKYANGALQISIGRLGQMELPFIKSSFLFRYDNPDFIQVNKGIDRSLGYLRPGYYRLLVLMKGNEYLIRDSIRILPDGLNYFQLDNLPIHHKDSLSLRIVNLLNNQDGRWKMPVSDPDLDPVKQSFSDRFLDSLTFRRMVSGRVKDPSGLPLSGVSVLIKGTRLGVSTDARGYFWLRVPEKGKLKFAYVGYESIEKRILDGEDYEITLHPASMALQDVVVTGFGISRRMNLTGSVLSSAPSFEGNLLMGKAAGIQIRGMSSFSSLPPPLIILDGIPYSGDISQLDPSGIAEIRVLKAEEATAIYGQNAAGGVILVTTKKAGSAKNDLTENAPAAGHMLRHHFRDDAFWQPRLRTDENGIATFSVTFPDDITNWRTFALAITDKQQTGFAEGTVKSFKTLSATIAAPVFLVAGDSANMIGKILNYAPDSLTVDRIFSVDDGNPVSSPVFIRNAHLDTFALRPGNADSLKIKYTLLKKDGYFDGEERTLPIYKAGVKETKGFFSALENDTSLVISGNAFFPGSETGRENISVYAEASVFPALLDEMERINKYEYLCNEQIASKLRALLEKKKLVHFLGKYFKEDKTIKDLINKLNRAKGPDGLWGWWNNNGPSLWISLHASEALLAAEKAGFVINFNKHALRDYLVFEMENQQRTGKLDCLRLLQEIHAAVDYKKYMDTIEKKIPPKTLYEKLRLLELKQAAGLSISLDTFLLKKQVTILGNWYWGEDNLQFFDNAFQNTLLMYRLLKNEGGHEDVLKKARNYFLEKRRDGHWRNTYESCLILEAILPDLMNTASSGQSSAGPVLPVSLFINDGRPVTVFPYSTRIKPGDSLVIHKKGSLPLYFSAYRQYWNAIPEKTTGAFAVRSFFERNGQVVAQIKAGEPVLLKVVVEVKGDAEYVMIEIPIPAGCSYKEKEQSYSNHEVHREYFKDKVSIFCQTLEKGTHTFSISLSPRYTGRYGLNPAKAEMMYFPVFYGREGMKAVNIF
ncbi:alpha-2-macroglobulin family protein [Flavitalea flava]